MRPIPGCLIYSGLGAGDTFVATVRTLPLVSLSTRVGAEAWRATLRTTSLALLSIQSLELGGMTVKAAISLFLVFQHKQHWRGGMMGDCVRPIPG